MKVLLLSFLLLISARANIPSGCQNNPRIISCGALPITSGRAVFHAYLSYGDGTSQMYLYKFSDNTLTQLSQPSWNIEDPMNGYFSPDGTKITFMGKRVGKWEIWQWTIGDSNPPTNLTLNKGLANEDPKYAPDGLSIYFKQDMDIKQYMLVDGTILPITNNGTATEESMPFPTFDGKGVYYTIGVGAGMGVYYKDFTSGTVTTCDAPGNKQTYYPITNDQGYLAYSQWTSPTDHADQTMLKQNCTATPIVSAVNDCLADDSDPAFIKTDFMLFSSTERSTTYRLFIGQNSSGNRWLIKEATTIRINGQIPNVLGSDYTETP